MQGRSEVLHPRTDTPHQSMHRFWGMYLGCHLTIKPMFLGGMSIQVLWTSEKTHLAFIRGIAFDLRLGDSWVSQRGDHRNPKRRLLPSPYIFNHNVPMWISTFHAWSSGIIRHDWPWSGLLWYVQAFIPKGVTQLKAQISFSEIPIAFPIPTDSLCLQTVPSVQIPEVQKRPKKNHKASCRSRRDAKGPGHLQGSELGTGQFLSTGVLGFLWVLLDLKGGFTNRSVNKFPRCGKAAPVVSP